MSCLKYLLRVQRKLAPLTMALGLVTPAVAHESDLQSTIRHPAAVATQLPGGPHLLSTVVHAQGSKIQHAVRPSVVPGVRYRLPARHPRYSNGGPMALDGAFRSDNATAAVDTAPATPSPSVAAPAPEANPAPAAAPTPAPAPAPSPVPQPENPNPTPPSSAPVPSLDIAPAATPAPQVPEVQPTAPGAPAPAAGVELPW